MKWSRRFVVQERALSNSLPRHDRWTGSWAFTKGKPYQIDVTVYLERTVYVCSPFGKPMNINALTSATMMVHHTHSVYLYIYIKSNRIINLDEVIVSRYQVRTVCIVAPHSIRKSSSQEMHAEFGEGAIRCDEADPRDEIVRMAPKSRVRGKKQSGKKRVTKSAIGIRGTGLAAGGIPRRHARCARTSATCAPTNH